MLFGYSALRITAFFFFWTFELYMIPTRSLENFGKGYGVQQHCTSWCIGDGLGRESAGTSQERVAIALHLLHFSDLSILVQNFRYGVLAPS
jgi:hypothetical protein